MIHFIPFLLDRCIAMNEKNLSTLLKKINPYVELKERYKDTFGIVENANG